MSSSPWSRASAVLVAVGALLVVPVGGSAGAATGDAAAAPLPGAASRAVGSWIAADGVGVHTVGRVPVQLVQPSDPGLGTLVPRDDAPELGMFGPQTDWSLIPLHATLAPSGQVVTSGSPVGVGQQRGKALDVWTPTTDRHRVLPTMGDYDSFCAGTALTADGRVAMVGGNTSRGGHLVDAATGEMQHGAQTRWGRWYGSLLRRPDGRLLVLGGSSSPAADGYLSPDDDTRMSLTPEIGSPATGWWRLHGARDASAFGARDGAWWYPRAYNAPDGDVLVVSWDRVWRLDDEGRGSVTRVGTLPTPIGVSGSSVMYEPGKVLFAGGGQRANAERVPATAAASVVDLDRGWGAVHRATSMRHARNWLDLTALPDGRVLASGGTADGGSLDPVRQVELWDPRTDVWGPGATAQRIRTYHSTALLLPSGAVLTGGGGIPGPERNFNTETFYPSYLFERDAAGRSRWADRPAIAAISGSARLGGRLTLDMADDRRLTGASLTNLGSVTHSYDSDGRRIPLRLVQRGSRSTVGLPGDADALPPGHYLLTVLDADGRPSPGQVVRVAATGSGEVTVYEGGTRVAPAAPPRTILTGDFDVPPAAGRGTWVPRGTRVGPWTTTGTVRVVGSRAHGGSGARGSVLETRRRGGVRTTLSGLYPGQSYVVGLRAARHRRLGPGPVRVRAQVGWGASAVARSWRLRTSSDERFVVRRVRFVARGRQVTLRLENVRSPAARSGSVLDGVVVRRVG